MTDTDYAVAPGEYLAEWIEDHPNLDHDIVAERLQTSWLVIDRLIEGRLELDPALAIRLEGLTGISTAAWLRYEQQYRDDLRRLRAKDPRTEKFAPAGLPDWDGTWRTLGQDEATMRKRLATWTKADLINANVIARQREIQLAEERPVLPALPNVDVRGLLQRIIRTASRARPSYLRTDIINMVKEAVTPPAEQPGQEPTPEEEAAYEAEIDRRIAEHEVQIAREDDE